ncbi:HNH endonuclease [Cupriavidus basilensis]|uniref:HNH endonuclease n=1 Tax=Cupriavidus basilensis TaxID=68895 RepID=UPI0009E30B9E|nr:HNH endonuclease [Cupriavidus basilensis]
MSYIILDRAALEKRAARTSDPRHRYYAALLNASAFDDYVRAIKGETPVYPRTFGKGRVPITPMQEYRYARDRRKWITEAFPTPSQKNTLKDFNEAFARDLDAASRRSPEERKQRLARASKTPKRITVTTTVFARNADVVLQVLDRANGQCEGCSQVAPFRRKSDNSPYLEVHHVVHLADGGEDTVDNALALCPNCHRRRHFGPADSAT